MTTKVAFHNNGVSAVTLLQLVENTAPFIFDEAFAAHGPSTRYLEILRNAKKEISEGNCTLDQDLISYFELCIAAHFTTVGTFVPTDVDQAIRLKLWRSVHHLQAFEALYDLTKEFKTWDESPVSKRFVQSGNYKLSGHQGEWFSIVVGAYKVAHTHAPEKVQEIREAIEAEVESQRVALQFFQDEFSKNPNAENLKKYFGGIAAVAHNLGDLDRMIDQWELAESDVLRRRVYRMGHEDAKRPVEIFSKTGEFYQKNLASENHRNLALREAKPLRKSSRFLIPFGPCLDDWGASIVREGFKGEIFNEGEFREIIEPLITGWKKLNQKGIYHSVGYARALAGIQNSLSKGRVDLENLLPPRLFQEVMEGGIRTHLSVTQKQYEASLIKKAVQFLALT